jgi:hypothetical protein
VRGYFTARSGGRETSETPPVPTSTGYLAS